MIAKKLLKLTALIMCLCIAAGVAIFLFNTYHAYNIKSGFTSVPLNFNPDDSSSRYSLNGADITVKGGFIKGTQRSSKGSGIVVRALSPLPLVVITAKGKSLQGVLLSLENINPDFYASKIDKALKPSRVAANTLEFNINLEAGGTMRIAPVTPDATVDDKYIILGDSRDGYETFGQIIEQSNAVKPVFVIDNGDLVYSGKPNQYRLFDQAVSGLSATICTTLGNHDIRGNGRETYIKLYGPEYYSFDFGSNHFIFLDSSRGYEEKQAIPDEQYAWLERDLKKAEGKRIYVISHVPPTDPRSGVKPNEIKVYTDKLKKEGGFTEKKLEEYSEDRSIDHGFQDKQEAERFENLMTQYKVNTVYLSHIHSYFDYSKNGVRYIISGGAGAELLTKNSYYHYMITKTGSENTITMIQLPTPANILLQRFLFTASMFAEAMYKENRAAVILFVAGLIFLLLLLFLLVFLRFNKQLYLFWILIKDSAGYLSKRFGELYKGGE